jgi:hypothetical protein
MEFKHVQKRTAQWFIQYLLLAVHTLHLRILHVAHIRPPERLVDLTMAPSRPRSLRNLAFTSRRNPSPGPPSPTFSDTTQVSAMNFGADGPEKIITRANLKASLQAYEEVSRIIHHLPEQQPKPMLSRAQLMNTSANYRAALITMSKVTAAFADAMETCSG